MACASRLQPIPEAFLNCKACSLHRTRQNVVPGHGPSDALLAFVAEAPGASEDAQGEPLVGPAGQRFNRQLDAAGLRREDVFLDNLAHCRPPQNKLNYAPDALATCPDLWLWPTLRRVRPRGIVALGGSSGQLWFPGMTATALAGTARRVVDGDWDYVVVGAFHPSHALRSGGNWNDVDESIVTAIRHALMLAKLLGHGYVTALTDDVIRRARDVLIRCVHCASYEHDSYYCSQA